MNLTELRAKVFAIEEAAKKQIIELEKKYAFNNGLVKVGDIVTDHYHSIIVDGIFYAGKSFESFDAPELKYVGVRVKKNGEPFKSGERSVVFQSNIRSIDKKKVIA